MAIGVIVGFHEKGRRFHCRKKDIKKEVESEVMSELRYEHYSDLKIKINYFYPTTDCEV